MKTLALCLLVVGCTVAEPAETYGSAKPEAGGWTVRLKVVTQYVGDMSGMSGTTNFVSFYDTTRSERCQAVVAADGVLRCLPTSQHLDALDHFAGSDCTTPVVKSVAGCDGPESPGYVSMTSESATCPSKTVTHVRQVFPAASYTTVYTVGPDGTCTGATMPEEWYYIGPEMAPSIFAPVLVMTMI